ncbi:MAG TPA: penicillin-binding protein 1C [Gammaproteobacteria bacterium]|nr:penicillin-binding protein 1C [Gammaproteobacteria bacterium]
MNKFLKWFSITVVLLFVSVWTPLFLTAPPLWKTNGFSQAVYDENRHLLRLTLSPDQQYRLYVPLSHISPLLVKATLLQEDQYFRWHQGVNPFSLVKAAFLTYVKKSRRVGASTITMQVARIRFGIHSRTWQGKIMQMIRAMQLEARYSKNEILEAYLNLAPYGNNIEGVGAASLIYFGKPASELTLPEALTLAVIPQNPVQRTPRQTGLQNIRKKLFIRWVKKYPEDASQQDRMDLPLQMQDVRHVPFLAPHFVDQVLENTPDVKQDIVTTLDIRLQTLLERITRRYLSRKKTLGIYNASVFVMDTRDMQVRALIGSANFFDKTIHGQINGTDIKRSPGSTLKPFIYGLALDQGLIHPDTVLKDVPHSFGSYNPENFDYDFMGPVHAKDALVMSRNIPAIYLADQLTHPNLYELLERANVSDLKSESYYGLALVLGGAEITMQELAGLYAMLVNDGVWQPLHFTPDKKPMTGQRLLSPEASFLVLDMLKQTARPDDMEGIAKNNVSWKTGTSSGYRDAWSVGVVGPYVLMVWIGNFDNSSNHAFVGKNSAAPLFFELISGMENEMGHIPSQNENLRHLNLAQVAVCKASGFLPTRYCKETELTWFIPGKSPIKTDTIFREVAIDKKTGLRTCHFNENTEFKIYEFWSSDLLKIFREAGVARRVPPPYDSGCSLFGEKGLDPQITSPKKESGYVVRANFPTQNLIPLTAVTDADVSTLHWFMNEVYLGETHRDQPFFWRAKAGKYTVRVVDDHGRSDAREVEVRMEG